MEKKNGYDAVVFDMDGVIFDSERAVSAGRSLQINTRFQILRKRCFPVRGRR